MDYERVCPVCNKKIVLGTYHEHSTPGAIKEPSFIGTVVKRVLKKPEDTIPESCDKCPSRVYEVDEENKKLRKLLAAPSLASFESLYTETLKLKVEIARLHSKIREGYGTFHLDSVNRTMLGLTIDQVYFLSHYYRNMTGKDPQEIL